MKIKCKVCGTRFVPCKHYVYLCAEPKSAIQLICNDRKVYDAMDCPKCGCQTLLAPRLPVMEDKYEN